LSAADIEDVVAFYSSQKCAAGTGTGTGAAGGGGGAEQLAAARAAGASLCASCHGANGVPTGAAWPNLLGQSRDYLQGALRSYASGDRTHAVMSALARSLSDEQAAKVAAYYSGAACK
jgi:cytochrome c553